EEEFEWGNPSATCLPPVSGGEAVLARAACRWRGVRAAGGAGPFHGLVALIHVPPARRKLLARLRHPLSSRDAAWLKSRDIPVCAPVLLSAFMTDDPPP
ncbi:DNA topoisomerase 2-binding protein 1, partial [Operophtera brumata]